MLNKSIFTVIFIISSIMFITSCEKNNELLETENAELQVEKATAKGGSQPIEWGIHRVFYSYPMYKCMPPAVNCFDDIVVSKKSRLITELNNAVKKGSSAIKNYFSSNSYTKLFPYLKRHKEHLSKLQSGNYVAITLINKNQIFYLFGKGKVDKDNPELVFVVKQ